MKRQLLLISVALLVNIPMVVIAQEETQEGGQPPPQDIRLRDWNLRISADSEGMAVDASIKGEEIETIFGFRCYNGRRFVFYEPSWFLSFDENMTVHLRWGPGNLESFSWRVYDDGLWDGGWRLVDRLIEHDDDIELSHDEDIREFDIRGIEDAFALTEWLCESLGILPTSSEE